MDPSSSEVGLFDVIETSNETDNKTFLEIYYEKHDHDKLENLLSFKSFSEAFSVKYSSSSSTSIFNTVLYWRTFLSLIFEQKEFDFSIIL